MIDATEVEQAVKDCLYKQTEIDLAEKDPLLNHVPVGAVMVEGMVSNFGFHPRRLEEQREKVIGWLKQLDMNFRATAEGGGGGWTFLNLPTIASGELWGQQPDAGNLMVLAIGLGLMKTQLPREMWEVLPGGVPYLVVTLGDSESDK